MAVDFRIGVTRDFLKPDGSIGFGDIGLDSLCAPPVAWEFLAEGGAELRPEQIALYDGLLVLGPRITATTLAGAERLAIIARFGVGYDNVDLEACTRAGVAVTITPDGVRRPVAVAALTLLLACAYKVVIKDRLTRAGRWNDKLDHMGIGVTGRTLGVIGLGNIGRELLRIASPLGMRHIAHDPFVSAAEGVELASLDALLGEADFVVLTCALSDATRRLINAQRLATMKPTAMLINVARGPIVDQSALTAALASGRLAGAGLDVFDPEPIDPADPLLRLENVIVSPHAIGWTDECFQGIGRDACQSLLDVAHGRAPVHVVNRQVLDSPAFLAKLARFPIA